MDRGEKIGLAIAAAIWTVNGIISGTKAWSSGAVRKVSEKIASFFKRGTNETN